MSTMATPVVPRKVSTRAKRPLEDPARRVTPQAQQCRLENILPEHDFGPAIEKAQRKARQKNPKVYRGFYARYGGVFKGLHPSRVHTPGKLRNKDKKIGDP